MTGARRVLVVRQDSAGDVLLAGPAVRAVAAAANVVFLAGPNGEAAANLLPGVDEVITWPAPWVDFDPGPVVREDLLAVADRIADAGIDEAIVFTSYHQSPLPTALVLRLAGLRRIAATCEDYPGSLLDLRHRLADSPMHEVQRMLALVAAAGYPRPARDDGRLAVRDPLPDTRPLTPTGQYVVVHPGASVPARAPTAERSAAIVAALSTAGWPVVVTGSADERALTAYVAAAGGTDLGGACDFAELADVLRRASATVVGNTGPAHLAAAVGTPVVSLFAPTVPVSRWHPWGVPHRLLGDQSALCAGTRARECPVPGHPCLDVDPAAVVAAVNELCERPSRLLEVTR